MEQVVVDFVSGGDSEVAGLQVPVQGSSHRLAGWGYSGRRSLGEQQLESSATKETLDHEASGELCRTGMSLISGIEGTPLENVIEIFSPECMQGGDSEVENCKETELENLLVSSSFLQQAETPRDRVALDLGDISETALFATRTVSPACAPGVLEAALRNTLPASDTQPKVSSPRSASSGRANHQVEKAQTEERTSFDSSRVSESSKASDGIPEDSVGDVCGGGGEQVGVCPLLQELEGQREKVMALSSPSSSQQLLLEWEAVVGQQREDEQQFCRWLALPQNLQHSGGKYPERVFLPSHSESAAQGCLISDEADVQEGSVPEPPGETSHGEEGVRVEGERWGERMRQESRPNLQLQHCPGESQCGDSEAFQGEGSYSEANVHQLQGGNQETPECEPAAAARQQGEQQALPFPPQSSSRDNPQELFQGLHQQAPGGDKQVQDGSEEKQIEDGPPMSLQREQSQEAVGGGGGEQLAYAPGLGPGGHVDRGGGQDSYQGCVEQQHLLVQHQLSAAVKQQGLQGMQHPGGGDAEMHGGGNHEHIQRERLAGEQAQQIGQIPGGVLHMLNQPQGGGSDQRVIQHKQQGQQHVFFPAGEGGTREPHIQFFRHDYQVQQQVKQEPGSNTDHVSNPYHHQLIEHSSRQCPSSQAAQALSQTSPSHHPGRSQFFAHSEGNLGGSQASRGESSAPQHTGQAAVAARQERVPSNRRVEGGMRTRAVSHQEEEQRRRLEQEERLHQQHQQQQQAALEELHRQELQALQLFQASGHMGDFIAHQQRLMQHQQTQQIHMHLQQHMQQQQQHQAGGFLHPHHHFSPQGATGGRGCNVPQNLSQSVLGFSQGHAHVPSVAEHPQLLQGYIARGHAVAAESAGGGSSELARASGSGRTRQQQPHSGGYFAGPEEAEQGVGRSAHQHPAQFEVGGREPARHMGLHHPGSNVSSSEVYGSTPRAGGGGRRGRRHVCGVEYDASFRCFPKSGGSKFFERSRCVDDC